ncbi:uncharacterized protein LOC107016691 [Solanum pennellii]|uniref:Uncharacterized protein LOC107016691 n=1 Tax=Solanum pennellii TaxID=28526 RepID=A0ABM1GKY3_SOLPN|nr:uncharacterized protein LOC107016691 [Solanum pennellii]
MGEYEACILGIKMDLDMNVQELLIIGTWRSNQSTSPRDQCDDFSLPFASWGMNIIGPIEPAASNGHRFILVAIDYFRNWVEVAFYKALTKKLVANFVRNNLICHFGVPKSIITDNVVNLNSHLMKEICEQFKITHCNSTAYHPQMNGFVEDGNKNIKRILRKMIENYKCWHEYFPYDLLGYRTTTQTSTGATPYLLVYETEAVIPVEVQIPSLRIIQEAGLSDAEWVGNRYEQLTLIDEKIMICHGQLYQQRMTRAFIKKVRVRIFEVGQLVLKCIFPHQEEYKGKFAPNWQGLYVVHKVLSRGALVLAKMDGRPILKRKTTFDLIPSSTGYVDATTVRSYFQ